MTNVDTHPLADMKMMTPPPVEPDKPADMVSIEVIPAGVSITECKGAVVRLVKDEGLPSEITLAAGIGGAQARELARQLLIIADAASGGTEMTMLCLTHSSMWKLPGQALIARRDQDGTPHFEFAVKPVTAGGGAPRRLLRLPREKLIVP
jgi:hypothetical protein